MHAQYKMLLACWAIDITAKRVKWDLRDTQLFPRTRSISRRSRLVGRPTMS